MAKKYARHLSQFRYTDNDADPDPLRIIKTDYAFLRGMNPELFAALPAPVIHALFSQDKNYERFAKRLARFGRYRVRRDDEGKVVYAKEPGEDSKPTPLSDPPFLARKQRWWRHALYSRTEQGDALVNELNPYRATDAFPHKVNRSMAMASITLGANRAKDFDLIRWPTLRDEGWTERSEQKFVKDEILRLEAALRKPRTDKDPYPTNPHTFFLKQDETENEKRQRERAKRPPPVRAYRMDETPYLLRHRAHGQVFVLGHEVDRDTEGLTGAANRSTIMQKYRDIKFIFDTDLYGGKYNFPNSIVLFIWPTEQRMKAAIETQKEVFAQKCPYVWHACWHDWGDTENPPAIDMKDITTLFTRGWKRLGYHDAYLCKFWEA